MDLETGERTAVSGVTRDGRGNITVSGLAVGKTPVVLEFTPGSRWCLAEGSTDGGMETWVLVQNPGTSPVTWSLILQTAEGPLAPASLQNVTIPARLAQQLPLERLLPHLRRLHPGDRLGRGGGGAGHLRPGPGLGHRFGGGERDVDGLVPGRGVHRRGHGDLGAGAEPGDLTGDGVDLILETAEGPLAPASLQDVTIPGASRRSFRLNDYCRTYDVSTLVTASGEVVAERATYGPGRAWATGSVGVSATSTAWCLAEGSTDGGMETWVLVQNPGTSPVTVDLILQTAEGPLAPASLQNVTIPARLAHAASA